ncbi:protein eva-1 homolog A [Electrophorus electricus]|uniref:protein eva-1 homolog A n=1 Tax=Electrophorus electricus TaxID=8005 RepID=UPI0015D0078C|nr:protein eva-1 homolog A [Electrophorus electricus]
MVTECVFPKKLLQESVWSVPPAPPPSQPHDPNVVGDSAPPDGSPLLTSDTLPGESKQGQSGPYSEDSGHSGNKPRETDRETSLRNHNTTVATATSTEMALISNALAAYTYITEHPERCALYFMCGVCAGLFLTLFALVVQVSCRADCDRRRAGAKKRPRPADPDSESSGDNSDSDWDTSSDLSARRRRRFERTLNTNVFTSAEELERAQRLEQRERIIREIWMNGQPDVPGTRSLNRYY